MEGSENRNQSHLCLPRSFLRSESLNLENPKAQMPLIAFLYPRDSPGVAAGVGATATGQGKGRGGAKNPGESPSRMVPPTTSQRLPSTAPPRCLLGLVVLRCWAPGLLSCTRWFSPVQNSNLTPRSLFLPLEGVVYLYKNHRIFFQS